MSVDPEQEGEVFKAIAAQAEDQKALDVCTSHMPGTPVIPVGYNGQLLKALVDTGAGLNLLSARIAPKDMKDSTLKKVKLACKDAQAVVLGEVEVQLRIGQALFDVNCCVIKALDHDIILGSPLLETELAFVDFGQSCLYLGKQERQAVYWSMTSQAHENKVELQESNEYQTVELKQSLGNFEIHNETKIGTPEPY